MAPYSARLWCSRAGHAILANHVVKREILSAAGVVHDPTQAGRDPELVRHGAVSGHATPRWARRHGATPGNTGWAGRRIAGLGSRRATERHVAELAGGAGRAWLCLGGGVVADDGLGEGAGVVLEEAPAASCLA